MPIEIRNYTEDRIEAVRQFNERLAAGGLRNRFFLSPVPAWLPKIAGRKLFQEFYLAVDENAAVRGAYILKHQDFWVKNRVLSVGDCHLPISEGTVDKKYSPIGVQLVRDAIGKQPLLYGLGMSSFREPLVQVLAAAGWSIFVVPFFFRVVHPYSFLRNITHLRRRRAIRYTFDAMAFSGLGWLGIHALQAIRARRVPLDPAIASEPMEEFSDWADNVWEKNKAQYGMSAVRDAETLRILYPKEKTKFIRLKISERSRPIGWAVLLCTQLENHKQFGAMRLGSVVDGFASLDDTTKIVGAAERYLESQGADLIVSNQSHAAWQRGFRKAGFLQGPSNFLFAASKKLSELLKAEGVTNDDLHFNRGDGDGPINL
jgi:hypothetical protein